MPKRSPEELAARKDALVTSLRGVHDTLTELQDLHNATPYKCHRHGACCTVGLQLHYMECEYIAKNLLAAYKDDPKGLEAVVQRLEFAFQDEAWTWAESVGEHTCAFFEDGCTIYPFRPSVCRMYGVTLEVDEWCPRKRLPNGESYVFAQKETDRLSADFYRTLDTYGRLYPERDYTVYMPRGVLEFLVPPARLAKLKAKTAPKFWKRQKGYRTQYTPSYRRTEARRSNVKFPFPIPLSAAPAPASEGVTRTLTPTGPAKRKRAPAARKR
ncbi:MAG TPA: YkgJ family cysteine cluster protein [Candidatus Thermoplasmatota archaeon]|nr:YkgJ family cysteine cluster protein [Candidatus Thermoplasmatota archaeon]